MKRYRVLSATVVVGILLHGGGCRRSEPPSEGDTARSDSLAGAYAPDSSSGWTVVGHYTPGVSAMTEAETAAWRGRTVRLTADLALSEGNHCSQPVYATRSASPDSLLATEFKLRPGSLAPLSTVQRVTVLEVSCGGKRWAVMGGRLIWFDAKRALAPWDGVFFELEKRPDFHAAGQEPFWRLEIAEGKEIRFAQIGKPDVVAPVPRPAIDSATGARTYHAVTEANDLRVVIAPLRCPDSMSGRAFEATVTVTFNGRDYRGCGWSAR